MKINIKIPYKLISLWQNFGGIPTYHKVFFVQQLGIMIKTGISLAAALKTLSKQCENRRLRRILFEIEKGVQQGNFLSQELEKHKKIFGELFINMVRSGEVSGRLETVLDQLYIQMKKDHAIVSKVKGAMIYPVVVLTAMVGVGILMIVYVIPSIISVFEEVEIELPLATRILIAVSKFMNEYGFYTLLAVILAMIILVRLITLQKGKRIFHGIILKLPIIGPIVKKINLARFCRTFSSLLKTDIAIIKTFEITSKVLGNLHYRDALIAADERIKKGERIDESLRVHEDLFPPVVLQMIAVGEETGSLDTILEQAAQFYEDDVDQTMTNFPSIIEPILIVILGMAVAGMALAVIMPIYTLSESL